MRALALAGLCAAALAAVGATPGAQRSPRPTVLAIETLTTTSSALERLDAVTLRRVSKRFQLWHNVGPYLGRSPDGLLAFSAQESATVHLIGQRPFRLRGSVALGSGSAAAVLWPSRRLLLVLRTAATETELAQVDPVTRKVLARRAVDGEAIAVAAGAERIAFLLAPPGQVGPLRLGVAGLDGTIRTVPLPLRGGSAPDLGGTIVRPGLAVDPSGTRAAAGLPEGPLVEIDLRTLRAVPHPLALRRLGRREKGGDELIAHAAWTGNTIALAGSSAVGTIDESGAENTVGTPTGLVLVDTRTWSARRGEDDVSEIVQAGDRVVATGETWTSNSLSGNVATGAGLSIYGDGGRV
ncbi:MAG: hypothetical protein QOE36_3097, partial [Gaiellaceae bacterium]|nr:hypothetical protein [Gaiellaceae bacterium]